MTDEEIADEYVRSHIHYEVAKREDGKDYAKEVSNVTIKQAYLAGLKAGRPKWHKPSEKLPADCSLVLAFAFEDSEPSLYQFVTSNTWEWMPRRIACMSNDQIRCWCEIPQYEEEKLCLRKN